MKAGELNRIAGSFASLLPMPWTRIGREFFRREGSWVQIIGFNSSRFAETYVPRSSCEFLKMPGEPTGGFLGQELRHPNNTQRWVGLKESTSEVFEEMIKQFSPSLVRPLRLETIKHLLNGSLSYWPHAYALCIMCLEDGDKENAQRYFDEFLSLTADKPYSWVKLRRNELAESLKLLHHPLELKNRLAAVEAEKLRALKCAGKL